MRMRGRITYKLLMLLASGVLLFICINYYLNSTKDDNDDDDNDDFIIKLPTQTEPLIIENKLNENDNILPPQPLNKLLNLTNFDYILNNNLCHKKDLLAILIVTSYAGHDALRAAHRQAISQSKLAEMGMQRIFLLAALPTKERFINQEQLNNEQQRFGDLLQGNFQESYRNLSYKHIMGLRWASTECKRAKFIIKLDDDIVYDVFQLRNYLESLEVQQSKLDETAQISLLAGYVLDMKQPKRNIANKWYVSPEEYAADYYPAYLSGWLYITNPATANRLVNEAYRVPYFWIDDTWVTGVLRERLHIPLEKLNNWYSANAEFLDCCVRELKEHNYECGYFVGPNGGDNKLLIEFLHNIEKCYFDECVKRAPEKSVKQTCVGSAKKLMPDHGDAQIKPFKL